MKEIKRSLRPPGGYKYVDNRGVTAEAGDFDSLVKIVRAQRERAGFPMGDPEADVLAHICGRYPRYCREVDVHPSAKDRALVANIANSIRKEYMGRRSLPNVPAGEAARRASICAACPHCIDWSKKCPPCMTSVQSFIPQAIRPDVLQPNTEAKACEIGLDSIAIAVYRSQSKKLPEAPDNCWRKV